MLDFLKGLFRSKFVKFLIDIFKNETGMFLEENYKIINKAVDNVGNISKLIENSELEKAGGILKEQAGIDDSVLAGRLKADGLTKSNAKKELAQKLIYNDLMKLGRNIIWHAINIGIEMAVARLK